MLNVWEFVDAPQHLTALNQHSTQTQTLNLFKVQGFSKLKFLFACFFSLSFKQKSSMQIRFFSIRKLKKQNVLKQINFCDLLLFLSICISFLRIYWKNFIASQSAQTHERLMAFSWNLQMEWFHFFIINLKIDDFKCFSCFYFLNTRCVEFLSENFRQNKVTEIAKCCYVK